MWGDSLLWRQRTRSIARYTLYDGHTAVHWSNILFTAPRTCSGRACPNRKIEIGCPLPDIPTWTHGPRQLRMWSRATAQCDLLWPLGSTLMLPGQKSASKPSRSIAAAGSRKSAPSSPCNASNETELGHFIEDGGANVIQHEPVCFQYALAYRGTLTNFAPAPPGRPARSSSARSSSGLPRTETAVLGYDAPCAPSKSATQNPFNAENTEGA